MTRWTERCALFVFVFVFKSVFFFFFHWHDRIFYTCSARQFYRILYLLGSPVDVFNEVPLAAIVLVLVVEGFDGWF